MSWHLHRCLCDRQFECSLDIIPAEGSRALCKEWADSICGDCLDNLIQHSTLGELASMIVTMAEFEPPTAARVSERVGLSPGALSAAT